MNKEQYTTVRSTGGSPPMAHFVTIRIPDTLCWFMMESAICYLFKHLSIPTKYHQYELLSSQISFLHCCRCNQFEIRPFLFAFAQEISVLCLFALGQNQPSSTVSLFLLLSGQLISKLLALLRDLLDYKAPAPVFEHAGPTITSQEHVHIQSNSICDVMSRTAWENRRAS